MAYRNPTKEETEIGIKAAKAAGIYGRDQVKWAVDMSFHLKAYPINRDENGIPLPNKERPKD